MKWQMAGSDPASAISRSDFIAPSWSPSDALGFARRTLYFQPSSEPSRVSIHAASAVGSIAYHWRNR